MQPSYSHTTRNPDGSYSTVTTSVGGAIFGWLLKWALGVCLALCALFWPAAVAERNLHGAVAWVVGVPAQLAWFAILAWGWRLHKRTKRS